MMNKNRSSLNQVFAVVLIAAMALVYQFTPRFLHVGSPGPAMAGFGSARGFPSIITKAIRHTADITLNDDVRLFWGTDQDANCELNGGTNFICSGPSGAMAQFGKGANQVNIGDGAGTNAPIFQLSGDGDYTFGTVGTTDATMKVSGNTEKFIFQDGSTIGFVIDGANQLVAGDKASGGDLTLMSTTDATKGSILFGTSGYDETNNRLGVGTAAPDEDLEVFGASSILRLRDSGATEDATLAFMEFGGTDTGSWVRTGYVGDISSANRHIHLQAELSELHLGDSSGGSVLVLSGGQVGINAATPITPLTLGSGTFSIKELASADAPTAAYGQLWVKTATPNTLQFTNDDGADFPLGDHDALVNFAAGEHVDEAAIDHGSIAGLADDDHTQYILVGGTRAFTGEQSMGTNKLTNVVDPTVDQDAATKKYHDDNAGGGALQTVSFGGTWDGAGNFLWSNGLSADGDEATSTSQTRHGAVAGTIQKMVFYHAGNLSSNNATIKIHVNGTPAATKTATGAAATADVFNAIGVAVNDGDIIEVEFDAGSTNPGQSMVTIMIE
ncbi:hypothetical protein LCGC14_0485610 [marine sediment metagenome]|uniref:Uncharacterized protein n=1 Tax=marine sediment metagenome TaxID=412755 RepID=A0A0F9SD93_9ZZZZ